MVLAGGGVLAVAMGVLALHTSRTPVGRAADRGEASTGDPVTSEEVAARRERLKRAAAFFGVSLPVLVAASEESAFEADVISVCLEMQERAFECRDAFVDTLLDHQLAQTGGHLTPAERAAVREARLRVYERDVERPLDQRRAGCQSFMDRLDRPTREVAKVHHRPLRGCLAVADCNARASCVVSALADITAAVEPAPGPGTSL